MSGDTNRYSWPYQTIGDAPDGPALGQDLAEAIEATVGEIDDALAVLQAYETLTAFVARHTALQAADSGNITGITASGITLGSPIVGVSFTAPPSGKVMASVNGSLRLNSGTSAQALAGVLIRTGSTVGSGSTVFDPSVEPNAKFGTGVTGVIMNGGASQIYTGLTPGAVYNASWVHFGVGTSPNYDLFHRRVDVLPLMA
jgi:hypothetical protein